MWFRGCRSFLFCKLSTSIFHLWWTAVGVYGGHCLDDPLDFRFMNENNACIGFALWQTLLTKNLKVFIDMPFLVAIMWFKEMSRQMYGKRRPKHRALQSFVLDGNDRWTTHLSKRIYGLEAKGWEPVRSPSRKDAIEDSKNESVKKNWSSTAITSTTTASN